MGKRYYSEASMVVHQSAKDLWEIGAISEAEMREFDERCMVEEPAESYAAEPSVELEHRHIPSVAP
jgi:putative transcriptional regulator